ncbi:MAG TPA: hypothetical protein VF550_17305, partial [Polyangia bacterium]
MKRSLGIFAAALLIVAVAWDFAAATTFLGDDYLFRSFARLERNPLIAFVADKHGGEYYRPLPMLLWWALERMAGGQAWPFALVAFLLHGLCAGLVVAVGRRFGFSGRAALLAGCLFFAAPAQREAALWFSASTDLLAALTMLGAVACFLSARRWVRLISIALAAAGLFCKETALVLPALLAAATWFLAQDLGRPRLAVRCLIRVLPHFAVVGLVLVVRFWVLHGTGGANDPMAPWWGWAVQLLSGLVHAVTAYAPLPEWVAWLAGASLLGWAVLVARSKQMLIRKPWPKTTATRVAEEQREEVAEREGASEASGGGSVGPEVPEGGREAGEGPRLPTRLVGFSLCWVMISLAPLPAAGWVVGARYFYLPAIGLMLLLALALESAGELASGFALATVLVLGVLSGHHRAAEVRLYRQAVSAASTSVEAGVRRGHRLFFVSGGVKDLDLAIKLEHWGSKAVLGAVVIPDVPASFIWLPPDLAGRLDFLLARPP